MAFLEMVAGPLAGKVVPLTRGRTVLGRSPDCDVVLGAPSVSRQHVCISRQGDSYSIEDLKTRGQTFVNNEGIRSRGPVRLKDGNLIRFCDYSIRFREGDAPTEGAK